MGPSAETWSQGRGPEALAESPWSRLGCAGQQMPASSFLKTHNACWESCGPSHVPGSVCFHHLSPCYHPTLITHLVIPACTIYLCICPSCLSTSLQSTSPLSQPPSSCLAHSPLPMLPIQPSLSSSRCLHLVGRESLLGLRPLPRKADTTEMGPQEGDRGPLAGCRSRLPPQPAVGLVASC